jgi:tRNA(Ile)-lysidine synthase TilS/MesJ
MHLCREHFQEDVQRKAREYLRQTGLFGRSRRILIELDGGRNSSALAYILKNIFQRRRDIDIQAALIYDGEEDSQHIRDASSVAQKLDIPLHLEKMPHPADYKSSLASPSARKREALFCAALVEDAGVIATGEDLDEEALEIFLRYLRGESRKSSDPAADRGLHWIKPLRRIPRREVRLYALILGLGSDTTRKASPDRLQEEAGRLLSEFESRHPGTNYSLLRGWERLPQVRMARAGGKAFK